MKTVLVALAASLALPALAIAQTATPAPARAASAAAATLPNTFDRPASSQAALAARSAAPAASAPAAPLTQSDPATVAAADAMLKKTIAAMQTGTPNYADMTADLAEKVRGQASALLPLFQQVGALERVGYVGHQDGAELFQATFANARVQWIIAQNPEGKIVALLFRPAPAEGA